MKKHDSHRVRRAKKTRALIKSLKDYRLTIYASNKNVYAQLFSFDGSKVITSASTLDKEISSLLPKKGANKVNAALVGKYLGQRAVAAGIGKIAFDRSGYQYHGWVKALADAARESGLIF